MATTTDAFWTTRNPIGGTRNLLRARRRIDAPRPPGPRGRPFVGVLPELKADPFGYLQHLAGIYGDVYPLPLPFYDVVVVNHPDHVRHIMNHRDGEYSLIGPASWIKHVLGASMAMLQEAQLRPWWRSLLPGTHAAPGFIHGAGPERNRRRLLSAYARSNGLGLRAGQCRAPAVRR